MIDKLQELLDDNALLRNIKTIITFILAFTVTTITQGLIAGFTMDALLTPTSIAAGIGMWVALEIVTNDMTERSHHEHMQDENIVEVTDKISTKVKTIPRKKARLWTKKWNKETHHELIEIKKDKIITKIEDKLTKIELKHAIYKEMKIPFWRLFKKLKSWRLGRKIKKIKAKIERAKVRGVYVPYQPTELEDFLLTNTAGERKRLNTKQRMQFNAATDTKSRMRLANVFKAMLFFGWQGFILVAATSIWGFIVFFFVTLLTLTTTAFTAYVLTRWTTLNVTYAYLLEKLDYINDMLKDIGKNDYGQELEEVEEPEEEETENIKEDDNGKTNANSV